MQLLLWAAFLAVCWFCYQLFLQNGRLQLRLEALEQELQPQGIIPDKEKDILKGCRQSTGYRSKAMDARDPPAVDIVAQFPPKDMAALPRVDQPDCVRSLAETQALIGERGAYRLAPGATAIQVPAIFLGPAAAASTFRLLEWFRALQDPLHCLHKLVLVGVVRFGLGERLEPHQKPRQPLQESVLIRELRFLRFVA